MVLLQVQLPVVDRVSVLADSKLKVLTDDRLGRLGSAERLDIAAAEWDLDHFVIMLTLELN